MLCVADLNRRMKLSHDPNNTFWSRSASKYGQKILQSHGWTPGELLGAGGAPYSDLCSAASASHIRVTLKDDNLGLGGKHDAAHDGRETTGLDVFKDLLGRLNGRSTTDLQEDRTHRSELRGSAYVHQRWGILRFVSGGLLVGAELRKLVKGEQVAPNNIQQTLSHYQENGTLPEVVRPETSKRKKHKKGKISGVNHSIKETSKGIQWSVAGAQSPRHLSEEPERESERRFHTSISLKDIFDEVQTDEVRRHAEKAERKAQTAG